MLYKRVLLSLFIFCCGLKAAIGSVALDTARENGFTAGSYQEIHGIQVTTFFPVTLLID